MSRTALVFAILGALNWLCVGLFGVDAIALAFGGPTSTVSRILYVVAGLAGLSALTMLAPQRRRSRRYD